VNKNESGIYQIVNKINGKQYIGSAINIKLRWVDHKKRLRRGTHHCKHLQNAWKKYGEGCFEFSILECCEQSLLIPREQFFIDVLHPEYNTARIAGSTLGVACLEKTKKAVGKANKNRIITKEYRQKMSQALKGRIISDEHKNKISRSQTGKTKNDITKKKISDGLKKYYEKNKQPSRPRTEEIKQKVSEGLRAYFSNGGKVANMRCIKQYSKDGSFIAEYESIAEAARILGISPGNIPSTCRGKHKSAGGYIWRYAERGTN